MMYGLMFGTVESPNGEVLHHGELTHDKISECILKAGPEIRIKGKCRAFEIEMTAFWYDARWYSEDSHLPPPQVLGDCDG